MQSYFPKAQPFTQGGGQHPAGCTLTFAVTRQPKGTVRLDCYRDNVMVMCAYNLSEKDAMQYSKDFMRDGHQLAVVINRRNLG